MMTKQYNIAITLEDDFGRVHTRIKTRYNPNELMDKIIEEYEDE